MERPAQASSAPNPFVGVACASLFESISYACVHGTSPHLRPLSRAFHPFWAGWLVPLPPGSIPGRTPRLPASIGLGGPPPSRAAEPPPSRHPAARPSAAAPPAADPAAAPCVPADPSAAPSIAGAASAALIAAVLVAASPRA